MSRHSESGNVFFALLGAVVLVGVLGAALTTVITGPAATVVAVTNKSKADTQMQIATRLAVVEAVHQGSGGDCDDDGTIEPLPPQDAGSSPAPLGGGHLPAALGAAQLDPWGTPYGYCAWNHGALNADNGCSGNLLAGTNYPDARTRTALAIISAGPDRRFDTMCGPHPVYVDRNGDDLVMAYTYAEAIEASGGLWVLKSGEPSTATIDRDVEVQGAFRMGLAGEDPGQVGAAACMGPQHINRMRYNSFDQKIEVCTYEDSAYLWKAVSGADACEIGPIGTQCADGAVYAGNTVGGARMYVANADESGTYRWKMSTTATPGTRGNNDGLAYTDAMEAAGLENHPAGQVCRDRGREWYLPSINELSMIYSNRAQLALAHLPTSSTWYSSSSEISDGFIRIHRFYEGDQMDGRKGHYHLVRCVRRDTGAGLWRLHENKQDIFYTGGNVGIRTTTPIAALHAVSVGADVGPRFIFLDNYLSHYAGGTGLVTRRARGTIEAPAAVLQNDIMGTFGARGHTGSDFGETTNASIRMLAEENWSDTARGTSMLFLTTPSGTTDAQPMMKISDNGNVGIGVTDPAQLLTLKWPGNSPRRPSLKAHGVQGDFYLSVQDNSGRVNMYWNTSGGSSPVFGNGGEHALNLKMNTTLNGVLSGYVFNFADGSAAATGDPIEWTTLMQISNNGRVGIGAAAPQTKLHIVTEGTGAENNIRIDTAGGPHDYLVYRSNGTLSSPTAVVANNRLFGLHAYGYGTSGFSTSDRARVEFLAEEDWTNSAQGTLIGFRTTTPGTTTTTERMRITGTGRVGIGVDNPAANLHVRHGGAGLDPINSGAGRTVLAVETSQTTDGSNAFLISTGNGTPFRVNTRGGIFMDASAGINAGTLVDIKGHLRVNNNYFNYNTGEVGIGTTSPSYRLHVQGTAYATGAAGALSDRRHKTDIQNLDIPGLTTIDRLRPVSFRWKEPADAGMEGEQLGFIAQEIEEILPQVVLTHGEGEEETKGIKPTALIPVLVKAVQELKVLIEELADRLMALFEMITALGEQTDQHSAAIEALQAENTLLKMDNQNLRSELQMTREELFQRIQSLEQEFKENTTRINAVQ